MRRGIRTEHRERHHKSFYPVRQGHQSGRLHFIRFVCLHPKGESPSVEEPNQGGHSRGLYGLYNLPSREMYASAQFPPFLSLKMPSNRALFSNSRQFESIVGLVWGHYGHFRLRLGIRIAGRYNYSSQAEKLSLRALFRFAHHPVSPSLHSPAWETLISPRSPSAVRSSPAGPREGRFPCLGHQ